MTRIELLSGAVIDATDIKHQKCIALSELRRCQSVQRTVLINEVKQVPAPTISATPPLKLRARLAESVPLPVPFCRLKLSAQLMMPT